MSPIASYRRVVHKDVEPAPFVEDAIDQRAAVCFVLDVAGKAKRFAPRLLDPPHCFGGIALFLGHVADRDVGSLAR